MNQEDEKTTKQRLDEALAEIDRLLHKLNALQEQRVKAAQELQRAADISITAAVLSNSQQGSGTAETRFPRDLLREAMDWTLEAYTDGEDVILKARKLQKAENSPQEPV